MYDLLKKGDKYGDVEWAEKVKKNPRERWVTESHERKSSDEWKLTNKNEPKNEQKNKDYT